MRDEARFQKSLVKDIKAALPDSIVLKLPAEHNNGIPDLLILKDDRWATLECKRSKDAAFRPNQEYRVACMNAMSFSRVIYPENKEDVLNELYRSFETERVPRPSEPVRIPLD